MIYKNKKTGAVINVKSELGGNWVPVEEPKKKTATPKKTKGSSKK